MTAGSRVWIRFPIGVLHLLHHRFFGVEWADSNLTPSDPSNLVSLCLNGAEQKGSVVDALLIPPIFHLDILPVFALQFLHWRLKGQVLNFNPRSLGKTHTLKTVSIYLRTIEKERRRI